MSTNKNQDEFEKALRAAFEAPVEKGTVPNNNNNPTTTNNNHEILRQKIKSTKKRLRDEKDTPVFPDEMCMDVSNNKPKVVINKPTHGKTVSIHGSAYEKDKRERIYKMCVGYADAFPEVCEVPSDISPDLTSSDELQMVLDSFQRKVQSHNELEMLRTGLITGAAVFEHTSNLIPGNPIKLHGLADNFHASITRFDACLKEIAIKYSGTCSFSPEQMLMLIALQLCMHTHKMNTQKGTVSEGAL